MATFNTSSNNFEARPGVISKRRTMAVRRRLTITRDDVLVLNGFELDASTLIDITKPDKRLLWAFVKSEDGTDIRPVAYSEDRVIWLTSEDLVRSKSEV